jgi:hypothetical protein
MSVEQRECECGCIGWECGLCGAWCWSCKEGGADAYPDFCDRCWCDVMDAGERVLAKMDSYDDGQPEQLEAEMRFMMRRLARREEASP